MDINGDITDILKGAENTTAKAKKAGSDNGMSFGDVLKGNVEKAIETQKTSETVTAGAVTGSSDMIDVLQAVTEAETTLNTVVAIRDRLIQAYQEVMRMPI